MSQFDPKKPLPWQWVVLGFLGFIVLLIALLAASFYTRIVAVPQSVREGLYRILWIALALLAMLAPVLLWTGKRHLRKQPEKSGLAPSPGISKGPMLVVGPIMIGVAIILFLNGANSNPVRGAQVQIALILGFIGLGTLIAGLTRR